MTSLPNPFSNSGVAFPPDEAAAPASQPESPAGAAADLSCIGEIFVGARKLEPTEMWFGNIAYPREDELLYEVLSSIVDPRVPGLVELPYGMEWALDPAPLFLRRAV